jgi:hypothetical protein
LASLPKLSKAGNIRVHPADLKKFLLSICC